MLAALLFLAVPWLIYIGVTAALARTFDDYRPTLLAWSVVTVCYFAAAAAVGGLGR